MKISILTVFSGIIAAISVLLSAWLSHSSDQLSLTQVSNLQTALNFAFIHCLAIFIAALFYRQQPTRLTFVAAALFSIGLVLFSSLIVAKTFISIGILSKLTPFGGIAFTLGWLVLGISTFKEGNKPK